MRRMPSEAAPHGGPHCVPDGRDRAARNGARQSLALCMKVSNRISVKRNQRFWSRRKLA